MSEYRFMPYARGEKSLAPADYERLKLLAYCVAEQLRASKEKTFLDAREFKCPDCSSAGFNTGWGVVRFLCNAERHSDGDIAEKCTKRRRKR